MRPWRPGVRRRQRRRIQPRAREVVITVMAIIDDLLVARAIVTDRLVRVGVDDVIPTQVVVRVLVVRVLVVRVLIVRVGVDDVINLAPTR
jgi:hypothetical protein